MQWLNLHYLAGLRALSVEAFWLDITRRADEERIRQFQAQCERFGFGGQWAVVRGGTEVFGMSERQLRALCGDCDLLINLCGALKDEELLRRIKRRAFFDLDPGFMQIWALQWDMGLSRHNLFFTVGLNVGEADFPVPTGQIKWERFVPPVAVELWPIQGDADAEKFTTIGQWRGQQASWQGEYYGSKREEFLNFIELPGKTEQALELALLIHESERQDLETLRNNGWVVVDPMSVARGVDGFQSYIQRSRGEFSVAKNGYVKTRSGWFSDRTVCYLASGRPALVQDTGFSKHLETGRGLLTFTTLEEAVRGFRAIHSDYKAHCIAARKLAEERFAAAKVMQSVLERAGVL